MLVHFDPNEGRRRRYGQMQQSETAFGKSTARAGSVEEALLRFLDDDPSLRAAELVGLFEEG
jgi:hypothetical protein